MTKYLKVSNVHEYIVVNNSFSYSKFFLDETLMFWKDGDTYFINDIRITAC